MQRYLLVVLLFVVLAPVHAQVPSSSAPLIFSAPPRESREEGERIYRPIVDYLSHVLGRRVEYRHPGNWGVYRTEVLNDVYDITFDEAHINSYRIERLKHRVLVKLPGSFQYAAIISYQRTFTGIQRMKGHTFCTFAPPNLGTMVLLDLFDHPVRQPVIVPVHAWEEAYEGVLKGKCVGALLPLALWHRLDVDGRHTKVLFHSDVMPNQAIIAGSRVTPAEQTLIARALLAPEAAEPTEKLRRHWGVSLGFIGATDHEYDGFSAYLKNERGFF